MEYQPQPLVTSSPYPYPQPPPPPPQQPLMVIITETAFGPETQPMVCPHCYDNISTRVKLEANLKTHKFAVHLCCLGLWCCAPCPYYMNSCMEKKHYCPSCGSYLGSCEN
ncbi:unnamed protein product [Lasius platythorax]